MLFAIGILSLATKVQAYKCTEYSNENGNSSSSIAIGLPDLACCDEQMSELERQCLFTSECNSQGVCCSPP